jgi:hypothetical protein
MPNNTNVALLQKKLENPNVQWFLYKIMEHEADKLNGRINIGGFNTSAGNSTAFGMGQFIGSTRKEVLDTYGIDAWSPNIDEQKLAVLALLDKDGVLSSVENGDFSPLSKGRWEAFHGSNVSRLTGKRPDDWMETYSELSNTAVYDPRSSWDSIPEDVRTQKQELFDRRYGGLPTEITDDMQGIPAQQGYIDPTLDQTAAALGLPTSAEQLQAIEDYRKAKINTVGIARYLADQYGGDQQQATITPDGSGMSVEDYKRAGIDSNAIANYLADQYAQQSGNYIDEPVDEELPKEFDPAALLNASRYYATPSAQSMQSLNSPEQRPAAPVEPEYTVSPDGGTSDRRRTNGLNSPDYMGILSDLGSYAARMGPLLSALRESSSYDKVRYPRFSPMLPTATMPKRDVRDAFATAQQSAAQQGRLDLGTLALLATQQAKETARVEESIANERTGLLNQAQQINNQVVMQEMADNQANKDAATSMRIQVLKDMGLASQTTMREMNMRRNDKIVEQMYNNIFGDV